MLSQDELTDRRRAIILKHGADPNIVSFLTAQLWVLQFFDISPSENIRAAKAAVEYAELLLSELDSLHTPFDARVQ